ncbi:methionyl-tRNA formyltransferase [bacterium]|nr:methionyl-tRNA formyltransferase [bacterium]
MSPPPLPSVVFFGTPEFAVASLQALVESGISVRAVVTAPDKPSGRGQKLQAPEVKIKALEYGLEVVQPESLKDPHFLERLRMWDASIFVVVAFRMLPQAVWSLPPLGTFNLHASLLPDYRGAAPINHALLNGDEETGVTTFLIDDRIDTGSLLLQAAEPIAPEDNIQTLYDRLKERGAQLVVETVRGLAEGKLHPRPQQLRGTERPAPKIGREDAHLRFTQTAQQCHNRVRAFAPHPGAWFALSAPDGSALRIKVLQSRWVETDEMPLESWSIEKGIWRIRCAQGVFFPLVVQPEGRKSMDIESFINGYRPDPLSVLL